MNTFAAFVGYIVIMGMLVMFGYCLRTIKDWTTGWNLSHLPA